MALWGQTYIKQKNARGDVFYSYGSLASPSAGTNDKQVSESRSRFDGTDNNHSSNADRGEDAGLPEQLAEISLGDTNVVTREHQTRRRTEQNGGTTRAHQNTQWEIDKGTLWPLNEEPAEATSERESPMRVVFLTSTSLLSLWIELTKPCSYPSTRSMVVKISSV